MDAVIFDCDGVLVDSEIIALTVALECLAEIGLVYDKNAYAERFLGHTAADHARGLNADHQQRFGRPLPDGFTESLTARMWAAMMDNVHAIAGAYDLLRELALPKAVASGSHPARLERKLRTADLYDFFAPHVYSAQTVARGKPAPDIYLHVAAKIGVAPNRCVAVEDSVNGVTSARGAGMVVVGFTGGGHCTARHDERLRAAGAVEVAAGMDRLQTILRGMP